MKNEKPRGTMLTSTAAILCGLAFAAGFLCGDIVSEYRGSGAPVAVQAPAPQAAQQAVAEVALNRMVSADFPNTMHDVIYGEGQFRSVPYLEDAEPWQTQYDAIECALYGPYVLPMDVMFFAQEATNSNVWGKIGGHVFCY